MKALILLLVSVSVYADDDYQRRYDAAMQLLQEQRQQQAFEQQLYQQQQKMIRQQREIQSELSRQRFEREAARGRRFIGME